jgi:hypothetical protein
MGLKKRGRWKMEERRKKKEASSEVMVDNGSPSSFVYTAV